MDFVAIDFETATSAWSSACSVAVVKVRAGKIIDSYYTLIRPPKMKFLPQNIKIHGITPEMVEGERDFAHVWQEDLRFWLEKKLVVSHNISFDMGVLRMCLEKAKLPLPTLTCCCTVKLSQKMWPELLNHKLNTMGDFLGEKFHHHHALEDARICAKIPLAIAKELHVNDFLHIASKLDVKIEEFTKTSPKPPHFHHKKGSNKSTPMQIPLLFAQAPDKARSQKTAFQNEKDFENFQKDNNVSLEQNALKSEQLTLYKEEELAFFSTEE